MFYSIGARKRYVVPVIIESNVEIPTIIQILTPIPYVKENQQDWFWRRLISTLTLPKDTNKTLLVPITNSDHNQLIPPKKVNEKKTVKQKIKSKLKKSKLTKLYVCGTGRHDE